jgi:alanine dehydrogenase
MPGAVPRTSTQALCNATLPYIVSIARKGAMQALRQDRALAGGLNICAGRVTHRALAAALGLPAATLEQVAGVGQ